MVRGWSTLRAPTCRSSTSKSPGATRKSGLPWRQLPHTVSGPRCFQVLLWSSGRTLNTGSLILHLAMSRNEARSCAAPHLAAKTDTPPLTNPFAAQAGHPVGDVAEE